VCGWGYRTAGQIDQSVAIVGSAVLVPCSNGIVYGLRLHDGSATYGVQCSGACVTGVIVAGGGFAVIDEAGILRAHRADTGQVLAERQLAGRQAAGAVLVPHDAPALAVIETGTGELVARDIVTGATKFSVATGDGNRARPVVSGGLVIAATTFGQLYAIVP
jgi:outer membrane protein assembly factor BamB